MPEKDKDKKTKEVSETDTLIKKAKLVKEAPTGEDWKKVVSGGKEYYVRKTKRETPPSETPVVPPKPDKTQDKVRHKGPPPSNKPKKVIPPKPKDTPKEEKDTEEVVMLETPPPPKQTGMYGSIRTYRKIVPEASTENYQVYDYPDETGNYTNKAIRKYSVGIDVIDPAKSYDDKGNFKPFFTGEKLPDPQIQQIKTAGFDDVVDDRGPNYKGSLMMPGTKATRMAGGGGGEFNQRNIADVPNALDKAPIGYIEQKYDTQGKPIATPNQGVQFDEKNLTPLRKGEMEVGKMYDIPTEGPVEIKGNFAKGGSIKAPKMKKYAVGGEIAGYNFKGQPLDRYGKVIENEGMSTEDVGKASLGILTDTVGKLGGSKTQSTASDATQGTSADAAKATAAGVGQSGADASATGGGLMNKLGGKSAVIGAATDVGVAGAGLGAAYIDSKNKDARGRYENVESAVGSSALKGAALGAKIGTNPALVAATGGLSIPVAIGVSALGGAIYGKVKGEKDVAAIKTSKAKMKSELAKANTLTNQQRALANRDAGILEGNLATPLTEGEAMYNEKDELINPARYAKGGVIGAARMMYAKGGTIVGKGGPKDDAIFTKANKEGIEPGSFIVPAENNEKAKGIRAALFGDKNKVSKFKKGGEMESNVAVSNGEHLFTPKERKKIVNYLGEEILEELAPNAEENSEEMNMGGMLKRADGSYSKRGLWDNIRANAGSGKKPTADMLKQEEKIKDNYKSGGYVVQASSDREGKTHKVTGPDGTVKYFGDPNLGQHPKDPARKEAFYARHKENLDNNPFFRAYARETWAEGGTTGTITDRTNMREYKDGGLTKSKAKIMLHEGMANGKPITEQQRKYFGWVAGGSKESKMDGGDINGYAMGTDVEGVEDSIPDYTKIYGTKSVKAPSVKGGKKSKKSSDMTFEPMERRDVTLEELRKMDEAQALGLQQAGEKAIMAKPIVDVNAAYPTPPIVQRKGLADYVGNIDPGAAFSAYQIMQGSKLLRQGERPKDVSKIDPAWNAAVERAQREASFGYSPEERAALEQQRLNALGDARFAGKNLASGSGTTAFLQERQAINQGWSNALQLKSADQQLRMQKQQYADQAVRERAAFLDSQRRRAFGDAMETYNVNQESGSALVGAGVKNAIGAFRYQKELEAQERAAKIAGAPVYKA